MPGPSMSTITDAQGGTFKVPLNAVQTLTKRHLESGVDFQVQQKTHHTTRPFVFERVEQRPLAAPSQAFYRLQAQTVTCFDYAKGQSINNGTTGISPTRLATDADTSLTDARYTPNDTDLAIGAFSLGQRSVCVQYSEADIANAVALSGGGTLAAPVLAQLRGLAPLADPGAIISPPQVDASFNLQRVFETHIKPYLKVSTIWQGSTTIYLGMGHHFTHAMGLPYAAAQGVPQLTNAFMVPEGYIWNRKGATQDSEMSVELKITDDVVIPASLPAEGLLGAVSLPGIPFRPFPERIILWVATYIHCTAFSAVSTNAG